MLFALPFVLITLSLPFLSDGFYLLNYMIKKMVAVQLTKKWSANECGYHCVAKNYLVASQVQFSMQFFIFSITFLSHIYHITKSATVIISNNLLFKHTHCFILDYISY